MKPIVTYLSGLFSKLTESRRIVALIWFGFALYGGLRMIAAGKINNYIIFKHVYIHVVNGSNLYVTYPAEYSDVNLYGPFFSLVIAPFSYLPDTPGCLLWVLASAMFLYFAITKLPISERWKNIMLLLSCGELMTTSDAMQTNALVCACILLGFSYTRKRKEIWALFFILAAAFIKIYGIAGLAFFLFSKRKPFFLAWAAAWTVVFFFAPLVLTNFNFLVQSYADWYEGLRIKEVKNIHIVREDWHQNLSLFGMIRRIFNVTSLNEGLILFPAFLLFVSQYLQYKYANDLRYQLYLLSAVLISVVIFSTGSEPSTYIIAVPGMILWYLLQPKSKWVIVFFTAAFLVTSFTYSDIFTPWTRMHITKPYGLKAFFPFVIWIMILVQVHSRQFLKALQPFGRMKLASLNLTATSNAVAR